MRGSKKGGGRILALAYVEADILRIPKWYDTQRSDISKDMLLNYYIELSLCLNC